LPRGNSYKRYPLLGELRNIFLKTVGLEDRIRTVFNNLPGTKKAYIYGSYAQNKMAAHSDIDLLVVGDHRIILLQKQLNTLQKELDREINTVNMDENEFKKRQRNNDPFILEILKSKHIKLK